MTWKQDIFRSGEQRGHLVGSGFLAMCIALHGSVCARWE